MNNQENLEAKATSLIEFQGLTLVVVKNQGIEYISAKPLVKLACIQWNTARNTLLSDDNATLYGSKELNPPVFDDSGTPRGTKKSVYVRLDRSIMFLSRVNTSQMRANGKEAAADALLKLQIEWAEALYSYESTGMAFKANHVKIKSSNIKDLLAVNKEKRSTENIADRNLLSNLMKEMAEKVGQPYQLDPIDSLEAPLK